MLKATFIGIDKYADASVRESCARRQGLWALVPDPMPSAAARLLTNADATIINVRGLFEK